MALSDILQKIIEEAKNRAKKIEKESKEEIKKIEKESAELIKQKEDEIDSNLEKKKEDIDRKMETLAKMEERNQLLSEKQDTINKVFSKAQEKLRQVEENKYKEILIKLFKKLPKIEKGEIIAAKDKKHITEQAIKDSGLSYEVSSEGDFLGGFIFSTKTIEVNSVFENILLKDLKPKIEPKIAHILFQES